MLSDSPEEEEIMSKELFNEPDLTPIWVDIYYDHRLQSIIGMAKDRAMVNRGCPFAFILECLFVDFPEIEQRYPPGALGFTLNRRSPDVFEKLKDGDQIHFMIFDNFPGELQ